MELKICRDCEKNKPFTDFNKGQIRCKTCQSKFSAEYRKRKGKSKMHVNKNDGKQIDGSWLNGGENWIY